MRAVGEVELPELHEHRAARLRAGRMRGLWRVADIGSGRKIAVLVLKHAIEHKKFLTAAMHMRREVAPWCVADDRGGTRDLVTNPVEHASLHTGHRRSLPIEWHAQRRAS